MKFTARTRLTTFGHASRVQSDQETFNMEDQNDIIARYESAVGPNIDLRWAADAVAEICRLRERCREMQEWIDTAVENCAKRQCESRDRELQGSSPHRRQLHEVSLMSSASEPVERCAVCGGARIPPSAYMTGACECAGLVYEAEAAQIEKPWRDRVAILEQTLRDVAHHLRATGDMTMMGRIDRALGTLMGDSPRK